MQDVEQLESQVNSFTGSKADKEYKYLDEMLTRNLIKLDSVESGSMDEVRQARKKAVKLIGQTCDLLELKAVAAETPVNEGKTNSSSRQQSQAAPGGNSSRVTEMKLDSEVAC